MATIPETPSHANVSVKTGGGDGIACHEAKFGAIMYDGWTKDSIHYIGIIGSFMRAYRIRKKNEGKRHWKRSLFSYL
jgi:hypothetical protein